MAVHLLRKIDATALKINGIRHRFQLPPLPPVVFLVLGHRADLLRDIIADVPVEVEHVGRPEVAVPALIEPASGHVGQDAEPEA